MNELSTKEKDVIREALRTYVAKYPSQNKAAGSLKNTSVGTISSIMNGKYENISDEMFRNIASQVGCRSKDTGWQIVETSAYQEIRYALDDAQRWRNVTWVVGEAGCGKTTTARLYTEEHKEVFYILCSEDMKKGDFVREIAQTVGIKTDGHNIREIWSLTEPVFHYFISMYNKLEDKSGIVFLSTDYIKKRISLGLRHQKPGYKEFFSRMGRKYFELEETTASDVYSICVANGVQDKKKIEEEIRDAAPCDFDLRRVKKAIHRAKRMGE